MSTATFSARSVKRYAERIQAAGDQMTTLIDDLLQLSRVLRSEIHLETVDLGAEVDADRRGIAARIGSECPLRH